MHGMTGVMVARNEMHDGPGFGLDLLQQGQRMFAMGTPPHQVAKNPQRGIFEQSADYSFHDHVIVVIHIAVATVIRYKFIPEMQVRGEIQSAHVVIPSPRLWRILGATLLTLFSDMQSGTARPTNDISLSMFIAFHTSSGIWRSAKDTGYRSTTYLMKLVPHFRRHNEQRGVKLSVREKEIRGENQIENSLTKTLTGNRKGQRSPEERNFFQR